MYLKLGDWMRLSKIWVYLVKGNGIKFEFGWGDMEKLIKEIKEMLKKWEENKESIVF